MRRELVIAWTLLTIGTALVRFKEPRENIWVTLANITKQTSLCLSLGGVTNPFRTCLVGVPTWQAGEFKGWVNKSVTDNSRQCEIIHALNVSLTSPPEELDLFGSANASLANARWVSFLPKNIANLNTPRESWATLDSSLKDSDVYEFVDANCNGTNITTPRALPKGIFLICGDRSWNGVPLIRREGRVIWENWFCFTLTCHF